MSFNIGDKVKYTGAACSRHRIDSGEICTITDINRSIDGAYDWDDLRLENKPGWFCEFDFEEQNND